MRSVEKVSRILIIDAGGTIAQIRNKITGKLTYSTNKTGKAITFLTHQQQKILRKISDFESIFYKNKDSTEFGNEDWVNIAKIIYNNRRDFSSFIITHGTATMCFTASALSFMLCDLKKPVVFTGSQIPMRDPMTFKKTDAWNNLVNSFLVARSMVINEVCIVFGSKILRGNRTTKVSMFDFDGFNSPNFPLLGRIGAGIEFTPYSFSEKRFEPKKFGNSRFSINSNVGLLKLYPGLSECFWGAISESDIDGLVIESYIPGQIPTRFKRILKDYRKKIIAICSQVGLVQNDSLLNLNPESDDHLLSAYDMTTESAISKLMWSLGQTRNMEKIRLLFTSNVAGELTKPN
jgi:L-asparaginase